MKILYFDTETTGRNPVKNDIVQLSGIIEIDGEVKEKFNLRCQPVNWEAIEPEALEVTGNTIEEMKTWERPGVMLDRFIRILDKYCDKYDKNDKFTPAGYNVRFDLDFLQQFFIKNGQKYGTGSYQNWRAIDGLPIVHFLHYKGILDLSDCKLGTLCNHYGIEIQAHDALSDIIATRELLKKLSDILQVNSNV